jgi:hypothetical protein
MSNPRSVDLSATGIVAGHLARLAITKPSSRAEGFTADQIRARARGVLARQRGGTGIGVAQVVHAALDELVSDPTSGVTTNFDGVNPVTGKPVARYVIEAGAVERWAR